MRLYSSLTLTAQVLAPGTVSSPEQSWSAWVCACEPGTHALQVACVCHSAPPSNILGSLADNTHQSEPLSDADKGMALNSH